MYSLKNIILIYILCVFFLSLSIVVGWRDVSVGTDTVNYMNFFNSIERVVDVTRFELLFKYLAYGLGLLTNSYEVFFMVVFLLFNVLYLYFYYCATEPRIRGEEFFILVGLMLSSSWYIVATTNGLRQGLSLPVLYLSLLFFSKKRFVVSALFFLVSLGFHKSSVLALPFFLLCFFRSWIVLLSFLTGAFFYITGISELLVREASSLLSMSLYDDITDYQSESNNWVGFQAKFFLYTVFWGAGFYFLRGYVRGCYLEAYIKLWKFYCVLMMPYFFFAFGAYSNRYAFIGWLLLPILQTFFIVSSRLSRMVKLIFGLVFFSFGGCSYLYYILGV